eukprot:512713-Prymnesium_polylepis.1
MLTADAAAEWSTSGPGVQCTAAHCTSRLHCNWAPVLCSTLVRPAVCNVAPERSPRMLSADAAAEWSTSGPGVQYTAAHCTSRLQGGWATLCVALSPDAADRVTWPRSARPGCCASLRRSVAVRSSTGQAVP